MMWKKRSGFRLAVCLLLWGCYASASLASQILVGGNCVSINGLYVSLRTQGNSGLLGNERQETALLTFARNNGFNYLILYDLEGLKARSSKAANLAAFIARARAQYGIQQIGLALGGAEFADNVVAYNSSHKPEERIDVLNVEYEFWNKTERTAAFAHTLNILSYFKQVAAANNLLTEIYIGWINEQEGKALASAVDRILVHYYRKNDTDIVNFGLERLQYLAAGNNKVKIAPIFSNEGLENSGDPSGYFMGPWLANHSVDQAFESWFKQYQQLNTAWKHNIEVIGASWFLYNHFADIHNMPSPANAEPATTSSCTKAHRPEVSRSVSVSSSATGR